MDIMTPKERIMTALRGGTPDRVPATPDIYAMVPCKMTGKPFWDIFINNTPPLWKAYVDAANYFDIEGWAIYGDLKIKLKSNITSETIVEKDAHGWTARTILHTPDGDLIQASFCPPDNPPTETEKMIKDFPKDFKKVKHFFSDIVGYDKEYFTEQCRYMGDRGIMSICVIPPGFQLYMFYFHGSVEAATYAYYDRPDLFSELVELNDRYCMQLLDAAIDAGAEAILTGGSGSITLQSPQIWRELSLPTIKKITKRCKEAGIISGIHSCGKERHLVEVCANETDLNYVNPLEIPPMGDCDLADLKINFGKKLALMGNLHTTDVMLFGSPIDVKRESLKAILAAGIGGGYVLSTGDQCGRDTPQENIFALIEAAKEFGTYPLDIGRIESEIKRLEKTEDIDK
jgi:uroporphyrinogen decarboxylase